MRFASAVLVSLTLCACVDRALDSSNVSLPPGGNGFDGSPQRQGDGFEFSIDMAQPVSDLASGFSVGVDCNGAVCSLDQTCCLSSMTNQISCEMPGGGMSMGACQFGQGYRCDGPEDCNNGRICVGQSFGMFGINAPTSTRCRDNAGMNGVVICHVDSDCPNGGPCVPGMSVVPGAPALGTCPQAPAGGP